MSKTVSAPRARLTATRTRSSKPIGLRAMLVGVALLAVIALGCVLLASSLGRSVRSTAASAAAISPQSMTTVVAVDGQGVPVRELELFLAQDRWAAFAYYQQHYGASDHPGFWSTTYGGEAPAEYLKKLAVADAVRATVQFDLAHKYGLIPDPGYAAFLRSLAAENARRAQALSQHQPIYGPEQYTETTYFTYALSQTGISLQATLVDHKVIAVTDNALRQYYNAHRDDYQQTTGTDTGATGPRAQPSIAPFTQVKSEVTQDYETSSYNALITARAGSASVRVDARVLAAIQVS
jgi:hypothetical protein